MTWTTDGRNLDTATHEAAHAIVGVLLRLSVEGARIDRPDAGVRGRTTIGLRLGKEHARRHIVMILAGPSAVGRRIGLEDLDIQRDDDAGKVAFLMEVYGFDELEFLRLDRRLADIEALTAYKLAVRAVADLLLENGSIPGADVSAALAAAGPAN